MKKKIHLPVLLEEVLEYLNIVPGGVCWDLTVGLGGHSRAILEKNGLQGRVVALDRDQEALDLAVQNLADYGNRVQFFRENFQNIYRLYERESLPAPQAILMDLGASSLQLDSPERGFSFLRPGPLDMRMDQGSDTTAEQIINRAGPEELVKILQTFGEEKRAKKIVEEIIKIRKLHPLKSTTELADIVNKVVRSKKIHPATRTFQALRIAVNGELENLEKGIEQSLLLLEKGGTMVVLSFHSLEDRIVKHSFRSWKDRGVILTKKPITATTWEIQKNPRSRSAKLRAFQKGI